MANDVNIFQCIGRIGKTPEVRYMTNGDAVCNFSVAVGWKSKDKEGVEWINAVAFKKLAEIVSQYCDKGKQVYLSGRLRTRSYDDKDGNRRYVTEVVVTDLQMLGSPQSRGQGEQSGGYSDTEEPWQEESIPF